ncbi:hypothetical protein CH379_016080 [Leptospira ellisii]|uniref:Uncharacterized protein n=1 Tax=Leptospira ellisii TaxID=2023197 RepID=A0A2N0BA56_9LEPT|nr:hypothetical protein [Leptospira ellisii]MDV6237151.1 hypothetical protein [Leptospira ellisii]PJZ93437.1 hypothetical protein CH379_07810 [Leptospira ellisii]PKA06313.1 hypothetical protein CH375_00300 [Leptospira ellisii]
MRNDVSLRRQSIRKGERRTISNFVENATIQYLTNEFYVSDEEMDGILSNKHLISSLKKG